MTWYNDAIQYTSKHPEVLGLGAFTLFGAAAVYVFTWACKGAGYGAVKFSRQATGRIALEETREGNARPGVRQALDNAVNVGAIDQEEAHLAIIEGRNRQI